MKIGCVKEIKNNEFRVGLTPANAREYIGGGHEVFIEKGAGAGAGFDDDAYAAAGAKLAGARGIWADCDMIVKVKEPLKEEYPLMRKGQILYTYLHLAADKELTDALLASGATGVAYETITDDNGTLPLLKPMSEIAGRLAAIKGAQCLEKKFKGKGVLVGGVPGVRKANFVVLGGGFVGMNAAKMAVGLGANVTVMDINLNRLTYIEEYFRGEVNTIYSSASAVEQELESADVVIGAVLIPGAMTPKLVKRGHLKHMQPGTVLVDVAVDQGGCCETTHATYHDSETFIVDDIVHYCVANMPGAVPYTSTLALTNATLSYGLKIANLGIEEAARRDRGIMNGINIYGGAITCKGVAEAFGARYSELAF
jgi:alanine dehydrogenase